MSPSLSRQRLLPLLSLLVFVLALLALHHLSAETSLSALQRELAAVAASQLLLAVLAALGSYALLTAFDRSGLALVGKTMPWRDTARVAFVANAFGHTLGMAALTGGALRWRGYARHGLDAADVAPIVAMTSTGFALGALLWLGAALVFEAPRAASLLPLPAALLQTAGVLLWAGWLAGLLWLGPAPREWTLRGRRLTLPARAEALGLSLVSVLELACAGAALYVLLPADLPLGYAGFIGVYVLAIVGGIASTVPAGLGVFEASLLLLLPGVDSTAVLAAIVLYRTVYYLVPLLLALLLLGIEALLAMPWSPVARVAAAARASAVLWPPLLALAAFSAGALLLLSGSLPLHAARVAAVPLWLLESSHLIGSIAGLALLLLARGLAARLRLAWTLSLVALLAGLLAAWVVGAQGPFLTLLALSAAALWAGRQRFVRSVVTLGGEVALHAWVGAALVVAASVWLGLFAYRHVDYAHELWWQFALDANAPRMLRASLVAVLGLGVAGGLMLLLPGGVAREIASPEERQRARALLGHARSANAWLALVPDKQLRFDAAGEGFLMYQRSGPCLVAMGDPVGTPRAREALAWQFREQADRAGLWPVFYQVGVAQLPLYLDLGLQLAKLGEEALVPLASFSLEGSERSALRQEHRRAQRAGCRFEVLEGEALRALLPQLRGISDRWLAHKAGQEKGFSLGWFDEDTLLQAPVGVVRVEAEVVAFANLWPLPGLQELSIDLMRQHEDAPKSAMDFLMVELMLWARAQGYAAFNLGMAPLAGLSGHELAPLWHKLGGYAWRHGERFYGFEGLRRFKAKFRPEWRPRYLASPGGWRQPLALFHIARLVSGSAHPRG